MLPASREIPRDVEIPGYSQTPEDDRSNPPQVVPEAIIQLREINWQCPVVRLPPEILAEIFEYACFHGLEIFTNEGWNVRSTRSAIISTCFRWREVGIGASILWTTIATHDIRRDLRPPFKERRRLHPAALLSLELERSQQRPLIIYSHADTADHWERTVYPVNGALPSCRILVVVLSSSIPQLTAKNYLYPPFKDRTLPFLETLSVQWVMGFSNVENVLYLPRAPSLRKLWLDFSAPELHSLDALSISNLTHLAVLGDVEAGSIMRLVHSSPELRILYWIQESRSHGPNTLPVLAKSQSLTQLQDLSVGGPNSFLILRRLDAPNVTRLRISGNAFRSVPLSSYLDELPRFPHLHVLELAAMSTDGETLASYHRVPSQLETLIFEGEPGIPFFDFLLGAHYTHQRLTHVWMWLRSRSWHEIVAAITQVIEARSALQGVVGAKPYHLTIHIYFPKRTSLEWYENLPVSDSTSVRLETQFPELMDWRISCELPFLSRMSKPI